MKRKSLDVELDAVRRAVERIGLGTVEVQVLKLAKHTSVRLAPHPIVARIHSRDGTDRAYADASRELMIADHLASRSAPAVRPIPAVGGPHIEGDCVITFWQFSDGRAATADDALIAARALRKVHEGLEEVPRDLPAYTDAIDSCGRLLVVASDLSPANSSDRQFLQQLYGKLRHELSRRSPALRPLHGDAHLGNVLIVNGDAIWMDLEAVCLGPVEWDLVTLPNVARREFSRTDRDLMCLLSDLRSLCVTVWCWADFNRSKEIQAAAAHHLNGLKRRFD